MKDAAQYIGMYGATYSRGKKPHLITAGIFATATKGLYHIEIAYCVADWGKPPKSYKNPNYLWEFMGNVDTSVEVDAAVHFVYPESEWHSTIELPIALDVPSEFPFTHVEQATLSKQVEGEVQFAVSVSKSESAETLHVVTIKKDARFSSQLISQILDECRAASMMLVQKGGTPHG